RDTSPTVFWFVSRPSLVTRVKPIAPKICSLAIYWAPCRKAARRCFLGKAWFKMKVSIVIRTYNEQRHLKALLEGIQSQNRGKVEIETIIVDSGSTDGTLEIANQYPVRIIPIKKEEFSF